MSAFGFSSCVSGQNVRTQVFAQSEGKHLWLLSGTDIFERRNGLCCLVSTSFVCLGLDCNVFWMVGIGMFRISMGELLISFPVL